MIVNGKSLFNFIDSILEKEGFIKKKDTWYKSYDECICFFSMGKSPYGGYYEHVMGGFLKELNNSGNEFPAYYKSDLKYTLENLADKELIKRTFDLENGEFTEMEREFVINELMEIYVIPFLKDISSKDFIKEALNKYKGLNNRITLKAKEALLLK